MKSTKWMINLGIILVLAALIGIIFSVTHAAGLSTTLANTARQEFDFGDAPDPTYPVLLRSDDGLFSSPLFGWLDGHVMDSELGDLVPTCTQAEVLIEPDGLIVPADPTTGYYGPVELLAGPYTVAAEALGYLTETDVVDITGGMTTTHNFNLWRPMIVVTPTDLISATPWVSQTTIYTLAIGNKGQEPLDFEIVELPTGADLSWVWQDPISGTIPGLSQISIAVNFHCPEPGEYEGALRILHTDPCINPVDVPILLHCRAPEWEKWVDGQLWYPEPQFVLTVETSDTITVTDVIRSHPTNPFTLTETWTPDHLTLLKADAHPPEAPQPSSGPGSLDWRVDPDHAEVLTLTKVFHVEPGNWGTAVLREELEGLDVTNPAREVSFTTPFYLFLPVIAKNYAPTALDGHQQALAEAPVRLPARLNRRHTTPR